LPGRTKTVPVTLTASMPAWIVLSLLAAVPAFASLPVVADT